LRQYWKSSEEFDKMLVDKMLLKPPAHVREDHHIWKGFQYKFFLTNDLYNYYEFFKKILYRVSKDLTRELVTVIEYRHIFGCLFDDDHKPIPLEEEIGYFKQCEHIIRQQFPLFRIKIIVCGLKIVGKTHIQAMLDAYLEADKLTNMISGFDMVNEEEYCDKTDTFLEQILEAKAKMGDRF